MTECLQDFLTTGLVASNSVNNKTRNLGSSTSHEFIEWCGLVQGHQRNNALVIGVKLVMQDLYFDFIAEYPDYSPQGKMTVSRTAFYRWLKAYALFLTGEKAEDGRDLTGRWFRIKEKKKIIPTQSILDI